MEKLLLFGILSIPVIIISWRSLIDLKGHGFYRFFSWECILWLFASSYQVWFDDPLSAKQVVSWLLLIISAYLVISGVILLKKVGRPGKERNEKSLYEFEKTTELVDTGIFRYIRHPLYSSLIFLTWGIFFKNPQIVLLIVSIISTVFLFLTALSDENECIVIFGDRYRDYMRRSKRFIPFII